MKNPVAGDQKEPEKALEPLVRALAAGFTESARKSLHGAASAACIQVEHASLRDGLQADSKAVGLEFRFEAGIQGGMLLVIPRADLGRIGGLLSGMEIAEGDALGAEILEACAQFFAAGADAAGRSLASQHGLAIRAAAPQVLNPEGSAEALVPLGEFYSRVPRLTFQLKVENRPDSQFLIWVSGELAASLQAQMPPATAGAPAVQAEPQKPPEARGDGQAGRWNIDLILDVELEVAVSFGETQMPLRDILKLGVGSVIELEKGVNDPVTIFVNDKPIASGEVVVVDGNYGVKVMQVESTADRIRSLG